MIDDPATPANKTPGASPPIGEPPPFQPDPELIGCLEREQEGAPRERRRFVAVDVALAAFKGAPPVNARRLRDDLDRFF